MAAKRGQKKIVKMTDLGKITLRENLIRVHPFLRQSFRKIEESEIKSEEVFKELFPDEEFNESKLYKLHAIYVLQN